MANIAERLGLANEVREIKLGRSFGNSGNSCFHSFRYDFKPASVDTKKMAAVDIGEGNQVTVTVPHIEGSGTAHTVFKGSKKPYHKECVLIIDHTTGEITLEKLSCNVQLKKTRAEGSSKIRSNTPVDHILTSKKSPPSQKHSPQQKSLWSASSHHSPNQKCSPLSRSPPNSQHSPTNQPSPSMPCLVPPSTGFNSKQSMHVSRETGIPMTSGGEGSGFGQAPPVGVLSDSSSGSSDSSSNASSSSESDSESKQVSKKQAWPQSLGHANGPANSVNKGSSGSHHTPSILPSMPKFSQLSEDLQLSDSDSDSDD